MPRSYQNISQYEKEILELKEAGKTKREIAEQLGFTTEQVKNFIARYNIKQRKLAAGIAIHKRGRPSKNCQVTEEDKLSDLRYKLAKKEARIKQLEMENELMRDFLSLTEKE